MFEQIISTLKTWNSTTSDRQKLQHCYLLATALIVLVSGVVSLFNAELGKDIVKLALVTIAAFAVNAIAWNLLQSSLLDKLSAKNKRRK